MKFSNWFGLPFFLGVITSVMIFTGCSTNEPAKNQPPPGGETQKPIVIDKLRNGDTVRIVFSNQNERQIPSHEEQIKDDGTINLQLIGSIQAAGKTTGELQAELQKAYAQYYRATTVIVQAPERFYSVGGEVKTPKRDVWVNGTTIIKAIQSAGDFTDFAKRTKVQLTRVDGKRYIVNCEKALINPALDLPVYPGDYIYVPRRLF